MSVGRDTWRRFRAIETIVDAELAKRAASERARRAMTEPAYKKAWHVPLFCCTAYPACETQLTSPSYCAAKGETVAAIVDGTEPRYAYELVPYRRKR